MDGTVRRPAAVPAANAWQQPEALADARTHAAAQLEALSHALQAAEAGEHALQSAKDASQQALQGLQAAQHRLDSLQQAQRDAAAQQQRSTQAAQALETEAATLTQALRTAVEAAGYPLPPDSDHPAWLQARRRNGRPGKASTANGRTRCTSAICSSTCAPAPSRTPRCGRAAGSSCSHPWPLPHRRPPPCRRPGRLRAGPGAAAPATGHAGRPDPPVADHAGPARRRRRAGHIGLDAGPGSQPVCRCSGLYPGPAARRRGGAPDRPAAATAHRAATCHHAACRGAATPPATAQPGTDRYRARRPGRAITGAGSAAHCPQRTDGSHPRPAG
jgi:hypothetical protein